MASLDSTNDYDALGTKMSSSRGAPESTGGPVAVVVSAANGNAKARGTRVVVWTVVGVIIVLAIVAIVVLATRQTNSGSDDDGHAKHQVHHLKHEVHALGSRLHSSQQNLKKTKNALALADEGLAICHATCNAPSPQPKPQPVPLPWGPGPVIPSGSSNHNPISPPWGPGPVIPTPTPSPSPSPHPILPPWGPGPVIPTPSPSPGPSPQQMNLVNPNLQPPRTFAFNLAQIPSGNYQTYCPDTPSGRAAHAVPTHLGPHTVPTHYVPPAIPTHYVPPMAGGIKDLEPFVDTLGDHGLVTKQTPAVMTPSAPVFHQPMVHPNQRAGASCGAPRPTPLSNQVTSPTPVATAHQNQPPKQNNSKGGPSVSHKTGEEVVAYLKMKPKGVIVAKFDQCGYCKKLMTETVPNLKTSHPVTYVDASEMSKLPKNMQVSGFPTIFLVDGDIKKTQAGYMPAEKLDALIAEVLG